MRTEYFFAFILLGYEMSLYRHNPIWFDFWTHRPGIELMSNF